MPVTWGERHYLFAPEEIPRFASALNTRFEPPLSRFLLRAGDREKAASGSPELPEEFQAYLLKSPIFATVTAVGISEEKATTAIMVYRSTSVTLNAGSKQGVREGMVFYYLPPGVSPLPFLVEAVVTKVDDDESQALVRQLLSMPRLPTSPPAVGWRLVTPRPKIERPGEG